MRRPSNPRLERQWLLVLIVGLPACIGLATSLDAPWLGVFLVAGGLLFSFLFVSHPFRLLALGVVAGGIAGLIAGGVGGRLAMRLISVMGGRRAITLEGTAFLLFFTAFFGAGLGILLSALRRLKNPPSWLVGLAVMVVVGIPLLIGDPESRVELLHEGEAWFNFPAFLILVFAYGFLSHALMEWLDSHVPDTIRGRRKPSAGAGLGQEPGTASQS